MKVVKGTARVALAAWVNVPLRQDKAHADGNLTRFRADLAEYRPVADNGGFYETA
ncbi:MAG: hypothetical protein Q8K78_16220 [Planctomycetaceae bacterium]|nr:hypothetical protein [Planctomycetaceae bacterium]